jgi:hypothetical protein
MVPGPTKPTKPSAHEPSDQVKAFLAWQARVSSRTVDATKDWTKEKLDPKDIGMEIGPALTEEQFKAYLEKEGIKSPVIRKL